MENIIDVAAYTIQRYEELMDDALDEMKLHKLLYFTQRECYAIQGKQGFEGDFEGWKYGPVSRDVRNNYVDGKIVAPTSQVSAQLQYIISNVIMQYGTLPSWKLSQLSHQEKSWINSRENLEIDENGYNKLSLEDILDDAKKARPYDYIWDMYYDEFEDYHGQLPYDRTNDW